MAAVLIAVVLKRGGGSSGRPRRSRWRGSGGDHMPWGGADAPFHPRDRDLRERAHQEAEAEYRDRQEGGRQARLEDRYGGDFVPRPPDDA